MAEKKTNPAGIPYRLSPSKKYTEFFLLSYLPKSKVGKEYLKVTHEGFIYRKNKFDSVESLLRWFKVHFKDSTR